MTTNTSLPAARSYAGTNHVVTAGCRKCGHAPRLDLDALVAGPHADTPLIHLGHMLRCGHCGAKDSTATVSYDDPRYRPAPPPKPADPPQAAEEL